MDTSSDKEAEKVDPYRLIRHLGGSIVQCSSTSLFKIIENMYSNKSFYKYIVIIKRW